MATHRNRRLIFLSFDKIDRMVKASEWQNLRPIYTTVDLQQAVGNYTLFTGTTYSVIVEYLVFRLPNVDVSDDATITKISIQTNDATPAVFISDVLGDKTLLTAESQHVFYGAVLIKDTKLIQLTIYGGASDASTVCDVVAFYRSVVPGGILI